MTKVIAISREQLDTALLRAGYESIGEDVHRSLGKTSGQLKSKAELAMFLTQVLWESGDLKSHIGDGDDDAPRKIKSTYGSRAGTTGPLWGRGRFPLIPAASYGAASQALGIDHELLENAAPMALNQDVGWRVALWYWQSHVATVDGYGKGFGYTTRAVNEQFGRSNSSEDAADRYALYREIAKALGITPLGPEGDQPPKL